jgi:choline dehydrogenase-like flavoprotein
VIGDEYCGLRKSRHRGAGGTANIWNTPVRSAPGAKYVPLEPSDFDRWEDSDRDAWPFEYSHLVPYYERAQVVCGLGPFRYDGGSWVSPTRRLLRLSEPLSTGVYQFGTARLFTDTYVRELCRCDDVQICHHAVVRRLEIGDGRDRVTAADATSLCGRHLRVLADVFVLAAGAVENARLLLLSPDADARAIGNQYGWVGRCLMEHPRDRGLRLFPGRPSFIDEVAFYDAHETADGTIVCGRLALDTRSAGLPGASITLFPGNTAGPNCGLSGRLLRRVRRVVGSSGVSGGYGWSDRPQPRRDPAWFRMLVNVEQRPNPDNRITLSRKRDLLGLPQTEMHWRFTDEEHAALQRLRRFIASASRASGLGQVIVDEDVRPDPNAHHHAGTTRMHADFRYGVVDTDLRVHGTANLFVTGSSVFPTAGFANPTLTIVALSLRLADHLLARRRPAADSSD